MASRRIESSRSKGKYISGSIHSRADSSITSCFEVGPPLKSKPANLAALVGGGCEEPEEVPKFDVVKTVAGSPEGGSTLYLERSRKKHKDILSNDFAHPVNALKQVRVPRGPVWNNLMVTHADGPHNFWVAVVNPETKRSEEYDNLCADMNSFYNTFHTKYEDLGFENLETDGFYVVRKASPGEPTVWNRCQIFTLGNPRDPVTAVLVDTGETIKTSVHNFRRIKQAFTNLPIRAYQTSLKATERIREAPEICERFKTRVIDKIFSGIVCVLSCDTGNMKKFQIILVGIDPVTLNNEWIAEEFE